MKKNGNSSLPNTVSSNLVQDHDQVADDWYLDPAEWDRMRAEVALCCDVRKRDLQRWLDIVFPHQMYFFGRRGRLRAGMTPLQIKARAMRALLRKSLTPDRILEFRRFAAEWRAEAAQLTKHLELGLRQLNAYTPYKHPQLRKLGKLRDEMIELTEVAHRLRIRESLLLKAIGAGLYMTTSDIHRLHREGVLGNRQFMELLGLQIRLYEGRSGRKHK